MPFTPKFVDLVRNVTTVTGTSPVSLGAAVAGYTGLAQAVAAGEQFYYCLQGVDKPAEREVGRGTMQANGTVAREAVSGPLTSFTGGTKTIALIAAAEWFARVDQLGSGGARHVTSRAALAALATAGAAPIELTEAGREGLFLFDPANHSARVAADPAQGLYIAPASDPDGSSGAWVRKHDGPVNVRWFGAVGDNVTNDGPAFLAALACLNAIAFGSSTYRGSARLFVPAGQYYLGANTLNISHTLIIEGENGGLQGGLASMLRFDANVDGIRIQRYNTSGDATVDGTPHSGGDGTTIRGLYLRGGYTNMASEGEHHGIVAKARCIIEDCTIIAFQGDGIYCSVAAGGGASEGNANCAQVSRVVVVGNRNGMLVDGADANAWLIQGVDASANRQWGWWDSSFLGNSWIGCHSDANGLIPNITPTIVSHGGLLFAPKVGREVQCQTNAPPASAVDDANWYFIRGGGPDASFSIAAWTNGLVVRAGGAYRTDDANAPNVLVGCYTEGGQAPAQTSGPTISIGGLQGAGYRGTVAHLSSTGAGSLAAPGIYSSGTVESVGNLLVGGSSFIQGGFAARGGASFGPNTGVATDSVSSFNTTGSSNMLSFYSWAGGVNQTDGSLLSLRNTGMFLDGTPLLVLRSGGANAVIVSSTGVDLTAGKTLSIDGTRVIGPRGAAVADATDAASAITQLNLALARLRAHGLIAP